MICNITKFGELGRLIKNLKNNKRIGVYAKNYRSIIVKPENIYIRANNIHKYIKYVLETLILEHRLHFPSESVIFS